MFDLKNLQTKAKAIEITFAESVESVRPRRVVSISPGEIVRLPNGGDEMRVSSIACITITSLSLFRAVWLR